MRKAIVEGQLVPASPDAPEKAICPACGGAVRKRTRRAMDGKATSTGTREEQERNARCVTIHARDNGECDL